MLGSLSLIALWLQGCAFKSSGIYLSEDLGNSESDGGENYDCMDEKHSDREVDDLYSFYYMSEFWIVYKSSRKY